METTLDESIFQHRRASDAPDAGFQQHTRTIELSGAHGAIMAAAALLRLSQHPEAAILLLQHRRAIMAQAVTR